MKRKEVERDLRIYEEVLRAMVTIDMALRRVRTGKSKQFDIQTLIAEVPETETLREAFDIYDFLAQAAQGSGLRIFPEYRRMTKDSVCHLRVGATINSLGNLKLERFRAELARFRRLVRGHQAVLSKLEQRRKKF